MWFLATETDLGFGSFAPFINAGAAMSVVAVGAWVIFKIPSWKAADHAREMERQKSRDDYDRELRAWHTGQIDEHNKQNAETRQSVKELTTSIGMLVRDISTIPCRFASHSHSSLPSQHSQPG